MLGAGFTLTGTRLRRGPLLLGQPRQFPANTGHRRRCMCLHSAGGQDGASSQAQQQGTTRRRVLLPGLAAAAAALAARPALGADEREGEVRHSDAEWHSLLTPEQYRVLRQAATEKRYSSPLVQEHRTGTFRCAGCGAPLFSSSAKFESGTGWPSFTDALPEAVKLQLDTSLPFMPRTEVRCSRCEGHLGHVFPDGPAPTGLRYCMNGVALSFEPTSAY